MTDVKFLPLSTMPGVLSVSFTPWVNDGSLDPHRLQFEPIDELPAIGISVRGIPIVRRVRMIAASVNLGRDVVIHHPDLVNLYGCSIGDGTRIGTFVEVQKNAAIGRNCKISSHSFICEGVTIEDGVFIGHGVMFTNDRFPRAVGADGLCLSDGDWSVIPTLVRERASIGSNATIVPGITIGYAAMVGAGAVVTRDVPDGAIVAGVPASIIGYCQDMEITERLEGRG